MSGRLGKVIGNLKFSNLEDVLITCYIVKISSPLLDYYSTIRGEPIYLYYNLRYFPFLRNYVFCNPLTSFRKVQILFHSENNWPAVTNQPSSRCS